MTKQRHCYVTDVGDAIEKLADALDPERTKPFRGDILDLLEWAEKDVLAMRQQLAERDAELKRINLTLNDNRVDLTITAAEAIKELRQQVKLLLDAIYEAKRWIVGYQAHKILDEALDATEPKP